MVGHRCLLGEERLNSLFVEMLTAVFFSDSIKFTRKILICRQKAFFANISVMADGWVGKFWVFVKDL